MAMSFRGAKHRCLASAHTDENGEFDLNLGHVDPTSWRCIQAMLVVETPRFLIDSDTTDDSNDRGELLQAMQLMLNPSGASGLSVPVAAERVKKAGLEPLGHAHTSFAMLKAGWEDRDASEALATEFMKPKFAAQLARHQKAKERVKGLSTSPVGLRESGLLISGSNPAPAIATAKKRTQHRLSTYAQTPAAIARLWGSPEELSQRFGFDVIGATSPIAVPGSMCELVKTENGPGLKRIRGLLDSDGVDVDDGGVDGGGVDGGGVDGGGVDGGGVDGGGGPTEDLSELETPALLERAVRQRITALISTEEKPIAIDGLRRLSDSLADFKIPGGPTDEVALHDFYSLQIAFESVWAEAFDGTVRADVESLYAAVVELHEEFGEDASWIEDFNDLSSLEEFLSESDRRRRSVPISDPPADVRNTWSEVSQASWNTLSRLQQQILILNAASYKRSRREAQREQLLAEGHAILAKPEGKLLRLENMIQGLRARLSEAHSFHYFQPNSVNFGILLNYRQRWTPDAYQVGKLVSTVPLAPSESRRVRVEEKVATSRSEREQRSSLRAFRDNSREGRRSESEILQRAQTATNFQQTVQGSLNFGIGQIGTTSTFGVNQANESARTKRAFHQAVRAASQEFRNQRQLEVKLEESSESVTERVHEISNPNDEIAVTYLMYELERRYRVSESLHRLTPVIMVAQDVPAPHEIDDAWLLAHEWILRRVLLDDSFEKALGLLADGFVGNEASVSIAKQAWELQKNVVEVLKSNFSAAQNSHSALQERLVNTMMDQADVAAGEPDEVAVAAAAFATGGWSLLFGEGDAGSERFEAMRKALELRLEHLERAVATAKTDLRAESALLEKVQDAYAKALRDQLDRRTLVDQLRVHVKDNILFYMQAIWDHEPPDQRFFRLYHVKVAVPGPGPDGCRLRRATPEEIASGNVVRRGSELWVLSCAAPDLDDVEMRPLGEIADIDRPLGFKGNYLIFALKECVYLTDFMMQEYVDDYLGIRDPDSLGEFSTEELVELRRREGSTMAPEDRSLLDRILAMRLTGPSAEEEQIVVPTGQLMMEVLPGTHPVLENFKRVHRAVDLVKVENEVRMDEFEALRYAARLSEGELLDPEIDRHIVVDGANVTVES